jgi:hypothetical protein
VFGYISYVLLDFKIVEGQSHLCLPWYI